MNPELWQIVSDAWEEYFSLTEEKRAAFLAEFESSNSEAATALKVMLSRHGESGLSKLEQPPGELVELAGQSQMDADVAAPDKSSQDPETLTFAAGDSVGEPHEKQQETIDNVARDSTPSGEPVAGAELRVQYEMHEEIAQGGMGVVWRGRDAELGRTVAVKVLKSKLCGDKQMENRFLEEARIMSRLQHPGIPPVHNMGRLPDATPFYAMKLIQGRDLAQILKERKNPSQALPRFLAVFEQVCQTIGYTHSQGILHRDLKPANIMVGAFNEVQVMDWGLAKARGEGRGARGEEEQCQPGAQATGSTSQPTDEKAHYTQAGAIMGTIAYMPPEQARGEIDELDERTDVFALGSILCAILTGAPAYQSDTGTNLLRMAQEGDLTDAFGRLDGCGADAEMIGLCKSCLSATKEDRPRDAAVVAQTVAAYETGVQEKLRQTELERAQAEVRTVEERRRRRTQLLAIAVVLLLLLAGTGIGFFIKARNDAELVAQEAGLQARALVDQLLVARTSDVPVLVKQLDPHRPIADPLLRAALANAQQDGGKRKSRLHAALALLPVDDAQVDYLLEQMLAAKEPAEAVVVRDALVSHAAKLKPRLWQMVERAEQALSRKRPPNRERLLRAACGLASFDTDNPRWDKLSGPVVEQLVNQNPLHLAIWLPAFRPVQGKLLPPLGDVFADQTADKALQRSLATTLLLDYAADRPDALADLLMTANDKQFAALFPVAATGSLAEQTKLLGAELDKKLSKLTVQKLTVPKLLDEKASIANDSQKVQGKLAKKFTVKLQAGKKYTISLNSTEFDTFLILQDKTGKQLAFDDDRGDGLNSKLVYAPKKTDPYQIWVTSYGGDKTGAFTLGIVEGDLGELAKKAAEQQEKLWEKQRQANERLAKRKANAAVALLKMGRPEKVWPLLKHSPDPRVRSYLIHRFAQLGADAGMLIKRLDVEPDITIRRALILSLGEYGEKELSLQERKTLLPKLEQIYRTDPDPGLHAAAEWLLCQWGQEQWLTQVNDEWAKNKQGKDKRLKAIRKAFASRDASAPGAASRDASAPDAPPQWYVNGQGQTFVVLPGPIEFLMGSPRTEKNHLDRETLHKRRIGRTFAIAAKPVTVAEYRRYNANYTFTERYAPEPNCPVVSTNWYQAAAYCNWLSKQEGIPEKQWCYETDARGQVTKLKAGYLSLTSLLHFFTAFSHTIGRARTAGVGLVLDRPVNVVRRLLVAANAAPHSCSSRRRGDVV